MMKQNARNMINDRAGHAIVEHIELLNHHPNLNEMIAYLEALPDDDDVNELDHDGMSMLHHAIQQDEKALFNYLLASENIDINVKNNQQLTPLAFAVEMQKEDFINRLYSKLYIKGLNYDQCLDLNCKNRFGQTPLHIACEQGHISMITTLLDMGQYDQRLDLNSKNDNGQTPLHIACEQGHTLIVDTLLARGADVSACIGQRGKNALHIAIEQKNVELVRLLLNYGIDVNADDDTDPNNPISTIQKAFFQAKSQDILMALMLAGVDHTQCRIKAESFQVPIANGHESNIEELRSTANNSVETNETQTTSTEDASDEATTPWYLCVLVSLAWLILLLQLGWIPFASHVLLGRFIYINITLFILMLVSLSLHVGMSSISENCCTLTNQSKTTEQKTNNGTQYLTAGYFTKANVRFPLQSSKMDKDNGLMPDDCRQAITNV